MKSLYRLALVIKRRCADGSRATIVFPNGIAFATGTVMIVMLLVSNSVGFAEPVRKSG